MVTGEVDVFLHLKEDTLYYYLKEPDIEAEAQDKADILLYCTAVSQALTFPCSQKEQNHTLETGSKAVINHKAILRQIPADNKPLTPPPSVFHARIHPLCTKIHLVSLTRQMRLQTFRCKRECDSI